MLTGIDWGGTKIEGVVMLPDGRELLRLREVTPRHDYRCCIAVILGSGAGAGIAVNGRAHHGPNNSGGEWGHNPLPFPDTTEIPGKPCYCGRHGCMETWVSGRSFEAQYTEHKGVELKAAGIIDLKRRGDHLLWQRYIDRVARRLATVAAGRVIGFFEPLIKSWDCLGAVAVIHAAGLKTSDFLANVGLNKGNPIIAGNEHVYAEIETIIAGSY